MKRYINIFYGVLCTVFFLTGCTEDTLRTIFDDGDIKAGDPVLFTTYVPGSTTRADKTAEETAFDAKMATYNAVAEDYVFNIEMYKEGQSEKVGSGTYQPTKTTTYAADGSLTVKSGTTPLYWSDNVNKYGFEVTAGSDAIAIDQSTKEKLIAQDKLLGYGFEPLWDTTNNSQVDKENALNYRTSKEWYAANKQTLGLGLSTDEYKKIPLYLQHQRSLITIILKAGDGVDRAQLKSTNKANIHTTIYSYSGEPTASAEMTPYAQETKINYTASDDGIPENGVSTMQYSCVVEPYDYLTNATKPIARINLSGQHFTFYASNDLNYSNYQKGVEDATALMNGYNLTAGKHLIITVTLGRESRKILITAYVEDWTEIQTTRILDDYGNNGNPISIHSREDLYEFLTSSDNKAGNVAVIQPSSIDLENGADWIDNLDLNCTLNMAGATFYTKHRLFKNISATGNLVNGNILVGDATITSAVAEKNLGSIERINAQPMKLVDTKMKKSTGKVTQAGIVKDNSGIISACTSTLPVYGSSGVVGGIAARSYYSEENNSSMPVIDGCTVNASVNGETGVTGGGIVGQADGRVTNNTFIYGITILQNTSNFKNSIHSKFEDGEHSIQASGNAWPTKATSTIDGDTNTADEKYNAVIASQADLAAALDAQWNIKDNRIRLSDDFSVEGWTHGQQPATDNSSATEGNVYFQLDGNNHTISTNAMLFSEIQNDVKDITIQLSCDLIATSIKEGTNNIIAPTATTAIAPFAYSVCNKATISNIQVKGGDYRIQAPTVGGIVVWAYGGAQVVNCQCKAAIQVWVPSNFNNADQKIYTGGIVANAADATITRCVFHSAPTGGTLYRNQAETYNGEVVTGADNFTNIFYGGILGSTTPKGTEAPKVLITDCTSYIEASNEATNLYKGAIVGFSQYSDNNSINQNGLVTGVAGCQGNWWQTTSKGIGTMLSGTTEEQNIGKRNAVTPTEDEY